MGHLEKGYNFSNIWDPKTRPHSGAFCNATLYKTKHQKFLPYPRHYFPETQSLSQPSQNRILCCISLECWFPWKIAKFFKQLISCRKMISYSRIKLWFLYSFQDSTVINHTIHIRTCPYSLCKRVPHPLGITAALVQSPICIFCKY